MSEPISNKITLVIIVKGVSLRTIVRMIKDMLSSQKYVSIERFTIEKLPMITELPTYPERP